MDRKELNRVVVLLRHTNPVKYLSMKKKWSGCIIAQKINQIFEKRGFTDYATLKESCPPEKKLGGYLFEVIRGEK